MSIDLALREAIREVVREEIRSALDDFKTEVAELGARSRPEEFISVVEASRAAHVHPSTVRSWINAGRLRAYRAGRHHRLKRSDLEQFMARLDDEEVDTDERARQLAAA